MRWDLLLSALFTAFSIWMYYEAALLPKGLFGTLGPGFFPKAVLAGLILTGGTLTIRLAFRLFSSAGGAASGGDAVSAWRGRYRLVLMAFLQFFFYLLGLKWLGFLASIFIFVPVMMWTLAPAEKNRKTLGIILFTTLLLTLGLYALFTYGFNVMLPAGVVF